jgi:hypothetical protein
MDCEGITVGLTHCLACGSRALLNLDRALSRHRALNPWRDREAIARATAARSAQPESFHPGSKTTGHLVRRGVDSLRLAWDNSENLA